MSLVEHFLYDNFMEQPGPFLGVQALSSKHIFDALLGTQSTDSHLYEGQKKPMFRNDDQKKLGWRIGAGHEMTGR